MEREQISTVVRENVFLRFLLNANVTQSSLLLKNLTRSQVNAVSEVFLNILHSSELSKESLEVLRKYKNLIRRVGERTSSYLNRRRAIARHPQLVQRILLQVESIISPFTNSEDE
jgi:hypothetical protein